MHPYLRRGLALPVAVLLLASAATLVLGQETFLDGKLRAGDSITVPASETVDGDLYLFGGTVTMDGTVDGDLVAFAGTIQVNGTVRGDILTAGGTINISGPVDGDVRSAGGTVTLTGQVAEDLVVAGGTASLGSGGTVGGDLIVSGASITVSGAVAGNIEGRAATYSRSGTVGGSENVAIVERDERGEAAAFGDNAVLDAIRHFAVIVLFGAIALWLLPRGLRAADAALRGRPLASLGGGLLTLVGYIGFVIAAVLAIVLLAIVFGVLGLGALVAIDVVAGVLTLGAGTFLFILAVAYLADVVVSLSIGRIVMPDRMMSRWQELGLLAAGAALVVIVTSLPVIGGLAKLAVVIFGLGGMAMAAFLARRTPRTPTPPPAALDPAAG